MKTTTFSSWFPQLDCFILVPINLAQFRFLAWECPWFFFARDSSYALKRAQRAKFQCGRSIFFFACSGPMVYQI